MPTDDMNNLDELRDITNLEIDAEDVKYSPETNGKKRKIRQVSSMANKKKSGNLSKNSQREIQQETKRNVKIMNEKIRCENMMSSLGNPWDNLSLSDKKHFALHYYYLHRQEFGYTGNKKKSHKYAAGLVGLSEGTVADWVRDFETTRFIKDSQRGKHSKTVSPINDPIFHSEFKEHVKSNSRKSGQPNLTANELVKWVNERLGLTGASCYTERTVVNWLHATGFKVTETKKAIYWDGHERADVVLDRQRFIQEYKEYHQEAVKIDPDTLNLYDEEKPYIIISQDEKINHSNDVQPRYWDNGELNYPPAKSQGRTVMTSDFVDPKIGFMQYEESIWNEIKETDEVKSQIASFGNGKKGEFRARRAGHILDVAQDRYYHTNLFLEDCVKAVDICKTNYDNKYTPVIVTDWSPIHGSFGENALNAKRMNVGVGGKQPIMKQGYYINEHREKVIQDMVFTDGPHEGKAKGLRQVCQERFGTPAIEGKKQDALVKMLEKEPDFRDQKPLVVEAVEAAGGKVLFGTKFHPELMTIENAYRDISFYMQRHNVVGSSVGYVERVCDAYGSVNIKNIRKYFLSVDKFMDLYKSGDESSTVFEKMKKQRKKHRSGAVFGPIDHSKKNYPRERGFTV